MPANKPPIDIREINLAFQNPIVIKELIKSHEQLALQNIGTQKEKWHIARIAIWKIYLHKNLGVSRFEIEYTNTDFPKTEDAVYPRHILDVMLYNNDISIPQYSYMIRKVYKSSANHCEKSLEDCEAEINTARKEEEVIDCIEVEENVFIMPTQIGES